jgi:hypothetical protein
MRKNNENNVLFVLYSIKPVSTQIIERKAKKFVGTRSGTEIQYLEVTKMRHRVKIIPHSSSMFVIKKLRLKNTLKTNIFQIGLPFSQYEIGRPI